MFRPWLPQQRYCGADGLMIEVHNNPAAALLCDGPQSITPEEFRARREDCERRARRRESS